MSTSHPFVHPWSQLVPPSVVVEEETPTPASEDELFASERSAVERAVPRRRDEFIVGRRCARRAMARLGVAEQPVVPGEDRAPIWPPGLVGSITHTRAYCAAAVARAEVVESVGIDVEPDEPVERNLWNRLCTDDELRQLASLPQDEQGRVVRLLFSARESFYKCQYPCTQTFIGFRDVRLEVSDFTAREGAVTVVLLHPVGAWAATERFEGRFHRDGAYVRTAMTWLR